MLRNLGRPFETVNAESPWSWRGRKILNGEENVLERKGRGLIDSGRKRTSTVNKCSE
jgi:hypothetical protein